MRFKRGIKVEVMNNREVPISWRTAKILSGHAHTYTVRYDSFPIMGITNEAPAERVSRKLIRPCPPSVEGVENLVVGDIVEVHENFSWKIASILKVVSREQYLVRLLGCSQQFCIHRSNIRLRQVWQDDKWTMLSKGSGGCAYVQSNNLSTSKYHQKTSFRVPHNDAVARSQTPKDCPALQCNTGLLEESHVVSSRSLKRFSPFCSSIIESPTRHVQKKRGIEKDSRRERVIPAAVLEKVDAVVYPGETMGEKYMHASFNYKPYGCIDLERENLDRHGCSLAKSSEANDYESDTSSVGSCSAKSRSPNKFHSHSVHVPCQVTDSICSDAESSYGSMNEEETHPHPPEDEVVANVHRATVRGMHPLL